MRLKFIFVFGLLLTQSNLFAQLKMRSISELTSDTSGWDLVKASVKEAKNRVEILPAISIEKSKEALYNTQVTTRSYMGVIVYFTGGILIDNGWIRFLGSGSIKLSRNLPDWNKGKTFKDFGDPTIGFYLIADDVLGGFFAINGGLLGKDTGNVYYLTPNTLQWESLEKGYSDFFEFCLNGDLNKFYEGLRWKGWEKDAETLPGDKVYNFAPFLWTKEGKDIQKVLRKPISIEEQYIFNMDAIKQLKQ